MIIASDAYTHKITGALHLKVIDQDGLVIYEDMDSNLVVAASKRPLAHCIAGDVTNYQIAHVAAGWVGTTPSLADTSIGGIETVALVSGGNYTEEVLVAWRVGTWVDAYPATNAVRFSFTFDYADAPGLTIAEFGLLTANGTLFARKVAGPITKTSALRISGTWTLTF